MIVFSCSSFILFKSTFRSNIYLTAYNWLNPLLFTLIIKSHYSVHCTVICNCNRSMPAFLDTRGNVLYSTCSVKKTIFTMQMQMNKLRHFPTTFKLKTQLFFSFIFVIFLYCQYKSKSKHCCSDKNSEYNKIPLPDI